MRAIPPLTDAERMAFVAAARACKGVRWRHQGRNLRGLDCAGLVVHALKAIGRDPVDCIGYPRLPYRNMLEETVRRNLGDPLPRDTALRPGDVVLMQCCKDGLNHVGIIAEHDSYLTMVHAHAPDKQVVEMRLDDEWRGKIAEVYR
jgi:cell wall-associated NlpC family hydrolase